jgi:uncharacterized membrane protein YuzA (DUF378 family)
MEKPSLLSRIIFPVVGLCVLASLTTIVIKVMVVGQYDVLVPESLEEFDPTV